MVQILMRINLGDGREGGIIGIEDFQEVKTLHYPE